MRMSCSLKLIFTVAAVTLWGNSALCFPTPQDEEPQTKKMSEKETGIKKASSGKMVQTLSKIKSSLESNMLVAATPFQFHLINGKTFAFDNVEWSMTEDGHLKADLSPISVIEADGNQRQISGAQFDELAEGTGKSIEEVSANVMIQLADGNEVGIQLDYDEQNNHLLGEGTFFLPTNGQSLKDLMMQSGSDLKLFYVVDDNGILQQVTTL